MAAGGGLRGAWMPGVAAAQGARPGSCETTILCGRRGLFAPHGNSERKMVERFILTLRQDFGCLVIAIAFLVIMISTILFASQLTPTVGGPFV